MSLRTEGDEVAAVRTDKTKHRRNAALSGHTEEVAQHIATITRPKKKADTNMATQWQHISEMWRGTCEEVL